MKIIDRLKAAVKTYFNQGDWVNSHAPGRIYSSGGGRFYWIPGTKFNWDNLTGELWTCPAVQACLNIIHRNLPQAPWIIRRKEVKGDTETWKPAPDHPLLALLNRPNPIYDGHILRQNIADSIKLNGNAYVIKERTNGGRVKELWWVPNAWVQPVTKPGSKMPMAIDYYRVSYGNQNIEIPTEDMIHVRDGCDPKDPRLGLSELASSSRDINTLQQLSTYKPNLLRNMGVTGRFVSPKVELQNTEFDPKEFKEHIDAQSTGDNVGATVVTDFPIDVDYPSASPKDLDVASMGDVPEANVCALMGVPAQVVGLHVGRLSKTYANMKEAREQLWEECLIPLGLLLSCQIGYDLLREYAPNRATPEVLEAYLAEYQLAFDYSDVRPLQPDLDALNTRELEVFKAGITTVAQFCANTFREEPDEAIADLYYSHLNVPAVEEVPAEDKPNTTQTVTTESGKSAWELRMEEELADMVLPVGKSAWEQKIEAELAMIERQSAFAGNGVH